jgi:hypothetical protein
MVTLAWAPVEIGDYAATLEISDDAAGSPQSLELTGTYRPVATLSTQTLRFGTRNRSPMTVTVADSGDAPLTVGLARIDGTDASAFQITGDSCSGHTLAPGAACQVAVEASRSGTSTTNATLELSDNASDSPQSVSLISFTLAISGHVFNDRSGPPYRHRSTSRSWLPAAAAPKRSQARRSLGQLLHRPERHRPDPHRHPARGRKGDAHARGYANRPADQSARR